MRRAAVSIAANIAEGFKKHGQKDKIRYYNISEGSLEETKYYIILSNDLNYITLAEGELMTARANTVGKLLFGLIKSTQNR